MKNFTHLIFLLLVTFSFGCAGNYKAISPKKLEYHYTEENGGVSLSYRYDVLSLKGNRRYAKKEDKRDIKVVAVKVTNNTDTTLSFSQDLNWEQGNREIIPLDPTVVGKKIKQTVPTYLFYLPLTLTLSTTTLPIGIPIAVGNMIVAGSSNKNFREELHQYNLSGKKIEPGQTVYGIISIDATQTAPIRLVRKESIITQR
ncbi:hypothetical protein Q0590_25505 [Rhodocytophaga aerolata]|uniref:Uncharacterized protein n=1 Tax=Rhodocytophaga aerolata TaxID=455078 RepID=A0ABT8RCC5_9BACT|nr:hypothetical protein [Rhodocytophaga aerolata]MDO1449659.1 hypothetical protein [Rhodocytophaga aerolata]